MSDVIRTSGLTKTYGRTTVVQDLSIHVNEGEIFGFLGVNGAGKTTTIGMLLGMVHPTSGDIFIYGHKMPSTANIWSNVGYVVGSNDSYPNLTVEENLRIVCLYRKIKDDSLVDQIIERLHLSVYRNKKSSELSLGNLQRLAIAKAMIHRPKLLILDEPTNGLDPAAIVEVRHLLKYLAEQGSTIFMSSHLLSEVSLLANRIAIIHEGRLVKEVTTHDLDTLLSQSCIVNTLDNDAALTLLESKGMKCKLINGGKIQIIGGHAFEHPEHISTMLVEAGFTLKELSPEKEDLESFFLKSISAP